MPRLTPYTGDFYGMGHNEMLLGEALRGHDDDLANGDDGCRPQLSGFLGFMAEIGQL